MCRWCESLVPDEATACPACGGLDLDPAGGQSPAGETNSLAVIAFVLAVLWLGGLASAAAVVLGATAKAQLAERHERGAGLAVAAIVLGTIGVVVGAALFFAAMVMSI